MIRHGPAPRDRAASTYSFSRIEMTWPRTIRPTDAQPRIEMTMITTVSPGPSTVTREIPSSRNGMASIRSMTRARTVSVAPPKYPEIRPTAAPTATARTVASTPTMSEIRAP